MPFGSPRVNIINYYTITLVGGVAMGGFIPENLPYILSQLME